ncbi:MAG: hypothetical protein NVSMB55_21720 [Mycobacteriales bacterium]
MVLKKVAGARTGEDAEDLRAWLTDLEGSPQVHETVVLACAEHGDERSTWAYVEGRAAEGIARRRCLACATTVHLLDSQVRWSHPPMWSCRGCGQSIVEVAAGLSLPDGEHVEWVVIGVRCVECGRLSGLTDMVVESGPLAQVLAEL